MQNEFQKLWKNGYSSADFQKNIEVQRKAITEAVGEPLGDNTSERAHETTTEEVSKPYSTLASLPDAVKKLPKKAQEIFQGAFNSAYKNPPKGRKPEEYAFRVAWSAVGKAGYKKEISIKYLKSIADLLEKSAEVLIKFGGHYDTYENGHYGGADSSTKDKKKDITIEITAESVSGEKPSTTTEETSEETSRETVEETKLEVKNIEKSFSFLIEKAYPVDKDGNRIEVKYKNFQKDAPDEEIDLDNMFLEGIATTANVDHDQERMSGDAMGDMVAQINEKGIPLMNEHQKTWDAKLGNVLKAWKDERNQLHIKAKLDKDNSRAIDLYKALKKGLQVGLSVAGLVKRSAQEFVESLGKKVKTFYDVALKEISVTNRPSNFDTWLIAKGQAGSLEGHLFENPHPFYEEYLQNYPSLNWQFEIAKSVAEVSKEVMPEETKPVEETKTEETSTEEKPKEKTESKSVEVAVKSQNDFMKEMADSFQSLAKEIRDLLKQVSEKQTPPDKETSTEEENKKKEIKPKDETETTDTEVTKPCKAIEEKNVSDNEMLSKRATSKMIVEEIEKRLAEQGKRLIGPLQETVEKLMSLPLKRKGIATEQGYLLEKKFAGNPYGENPPEEGEEIEKDMKDKDVDFKTYFKKHLSSFRIENTK